MAWYFGLKEGMILYPDGATMAKAYAGGNLGMYPEAINNPAMEGIKNVGPLPEGGYTLGMAINSQKLGPVAIPLMPDPTNDMHGRSGFFVHGDTAIPGHASEGCIVTGRSTRQAMDKSPDKRLLVVASLLTAGAVKGDSTAVSGAPATNSQGG